MREIHCQKSSGTHCTRALLAVLCTSLVGACSTDAQHSADGLAYWALAQQSGYASWSTESDRSAFERFKAMHDRSEMFANPGLKMEYKVLFSRVSEVDLVQEVENKRRTLFAPEGPVLTLMNASQVSALEELFERTVGDLSADVSPYTRTPTLLQYLDIPTYSFDATDAFAEVSEDLLPLLYGLYQVGEHDEWEESTTHQVDGAQVVGSLVFHRRHRDLSVYRDYLRLSFSYEPDLWPHGLILRQIDARWHRDAALGPVHAPRTRNELERVALEAFEDTHPYAEGVSVDALEPHYYAFRGVVHATYPIEVAADDLIRWLYEIDASTLEVVTAYDRAPRLQYSGTLYAPVTNIRENYTGVANKSDYPIPHAVLYNAAEWGWQTGSCSGLALYGDPGEIIGETNYDGEFTIDASSWVWIDGNFGYSLDASYPDASMANITLYNGPNHDDDFPVCYLGGSFAPDNGDVDMSWNSLSNNLNDGFYGRPSEMRYHLEVAKNWLDPLGVTTYEPIKYSYRSHDGYSSGYCTGASTNSVRVGCSESDYHVAGAYNDNANEVIFRGVLHHEFGHTIYYATGGPDYNQSRYYMRGHAFNEGHAITTNGVLTTYESQLNAYTGSDRKWPDSTGSDPDCCCSPDTTCYTNSYKQGSIFTAIHNDYIWMVGNAAYKYVSDYVAAVDDETWMVGDCDDEYDISTCTNSCSTGTNTFYRQLLAQASLHNDEYEVSKAFHNHVVDSYVRSEGVSCQSPEHEMPQYDWYDDTSIDNFPYMDDVTDHFANAPIVSTEDADYVSGTLTTYDVVDDVPDEYLEQALFFTSVHDDDIFAFVGRAGETYVLETLNLDQGLDTGLLVKTETGASVTNGDDTCSPRSCREFAPAQTAIYKALVWAEVGSSTGAAYTYNFRISMKNDDFADARQKAHPVQPTNLWKSGYINSSADSDWFFFYLSQSRSVGYLLCNTGIASSTINIRNASGSLEATAAGQSTCTSNSTVILAAGIHYVEVVGSGGATGAYNFRISATDDLSTSGADALDLDTLVMPDYLVGDVKFVPTEFETSSDEDWFRFSADRGETWCLDTIDVTSTAKTRLTVYAPQDSFQGTNGMSWTATPASSYSFAVMEDTRGDANYRGSHLCFVPAFDSTYYVRVSNDQSATGGYTLAVWDFPTTQTSYPRIPGS